VRPGEVFEAANEDHVYLNRAIIAYGWAA
jgi:hypothetical protein